jgi:hypothetical protein
MMQIKEPKAPASPAQLAYLESLTTQRDLPTVCERYALLKGLGALTKGTASQFIDQLLAAPKKAPKIEAKTVTIHTTVDPQVAAALIEAPAKPQLTEAPVFGYYWITDKLTGKPQLYYWDCTGKDAYPTLRRLVIWETYSGGKKGSWKKVQHEAGALGKQFGFCVRCGATLTDPVSVANGLGPVCAKYWA